MLLSLLAGILDSEAVAGVAELPCATSGTMPESYSPTRVSVSHSLKKQVRSGNAQQWSFKLNWENLDRLEAGVLAAFINRQRGQYGAFELHLPGDFKNSAANPTGVPLLQVDTAAGVEYLSTMGWAAGALVLKAGDFLRLSSGTKLYQVVADVVSDGSGAATVPIFPQLYAPAADSTSLIVNNITMLSRLKDDRTAYPLKAPLFVSASFEFVEVLP